MVSRISSNSIVNSNVWRLNPTVFVIECIFFNYLDYYFFFIRTMTQNIFINCSKNIQYFVLFFFAGNFSLLITIFNFVFVHINLLIMAYKESYIWSWFMFIFYFLYCNINNLIHWIHVLTFKSLKHRLVSWIVQTRVLNKSAIFQINWNFTNLYI